MGTTSTSIHTSKMVSIPLVFLLRRFFCIIFFLGNIHGCFSLNDRHRDNHEVVRERCIESEKRALIDIEKGIYDPGARLSSWRKGGDCCNWRGVNCDNITGHVIKLDLRFPYPNYNQYENPMGPSKLSPSLLGLMHLNYLDLSWNNFSGIPIPNFIGSLVNLEYLNLSLCSFSGTIPRQLENLLKLQYLDLSGNNNFSATLSVDNLQWLSQMNSMHHLELSRVNLSKAVQWIHDINMLPALSVLGLADCELSIISATLPPINNFTYLTTIDLSFNNIQSWNLEILGSFSRLKFLYLPNCGINAAIPNNFWNLSMNLEHLDLSYNQIPGNIPEILGNYSQLEYLDMSSNNLCGEIPNSIGRLHNLISLSLTWNQIRGSIPTSIGNLANLNSLSLDFNMINGEIPESLFNLSQLQELGLESNNISGHLPRAIGNLYNLEGLWLYDNNINGQIPNFNTSVLQVINLSNNSLTGSIPLSLGASLGIIHIDLSQNHLSGKIPLFICNLTSLQSLALFSNNLNGRIPPCYFHLPLLQLLDLANNNLSGTIAHCRNTSSQLAILELSSNSLSSHIPDSFGYFNQLQSLHLGNNELTGTIPPSLKNCRLLVILDISENILSGGIPEWVGESLSSLRFLSLRSNWFSGNIPKQLSYLSSLQVLDLSNNNLVGILSMTFGNFSAMNTTESAGGEIVNTLLYYQENLQLITKGISLDYTSVLSAVTTIDLSRNYLSGEIPTGLMQLSGLCFLNLSQNHFTGKIPQNFSAMQQLQSLDLSTNNLSGKIPPSVYGLHFLSHLNLSNNRLSGQIPPGGIQFLTFNDPSIYSGNHDLCGWPLPQCPSNGPSDKSRHNYSEKGVEHQERSDTVWFYVSATLGFVVCFWGFVGTLMIHKPIRYAYFGYVDMLYDWMYVKSAINIARLKSIFGDQQ